MALSLLLLAALAAAQKPTDLPTLTRPLDTLMPTYTPTATGPKTTVTVPIMGMEFVDRRFPVMSWYASIVGVDRDINATTFAADYGYHPTRTDLSHISFTYGPSGYNTTNEDDDSSYTCEIEEEQNRMACLREKDGEVEEDVRERLKDMYANVTVTAGVSLLESSAPSADDGEDTSDNGNGSGNEDGNGGDDEGAASAGVAVNLVVAGLGVLAALGMV
jgi:hypothetical protein